MTVDEFNSLMEVVSYGIADEEESFKQCQKEDDMHLSDHVYFHYKRLQHMINVPGDFFYQLHRFCRIAGIKKLSFVDKLGISYSYIGIDDSEFQIGSGNNILTNYVLEEPEDEEEDFDDNNDEETDGVLGDFIGGDGV